MTDPAMDISDLVEDLPESQVMGGFFRVCKNLNLELDEFNIDDPEHYEALSLELRTLAVARFTEGFVHDQLARGNIHINDVAVTPNGELRLTGAAREAIRRHADLD